MQVELQEKASFKNSSSFSPSAKHHNSMKIQFSIIVIFAALAAVVYGIPAHNDHIGRALMRRGCNWSRL
jgi:hypothetical protein